MAVAGADTPLSSCATGICPPLPPIASHRIPSKWSALADTLKAVDMNGTAVCRGAASPTRACACACAVLGSDACSFCKLLHACRRMRNSLA